jgi:hypothetical protein
MASKPRLRLSLVKCGTCGKRYSNPAAHTCVVPARRKSSRTKLAPKLTASYTCPSCGKQASNPLAHVCKSKRGDFRRRKAAAVKRERQARRDASKHDYATCPDGEQCERYPCRIYAEGYRRGHSNGFEEGHEAGYAEGVAAAQAAAERG